MSIAPRTHAAAPNITSRLIVTHDVHLCEMSPASLFCTASEPFAAARVSRPCESGQASQTMCGVCAPH